MGTALKMEVSPETIVKNMTTTARRAFLEDLIAATSPEYLQSLREACRDYKAGRVNSHTHVFVPVTCRLVYTHRAIKMSKPLV